MKKIISLFVILIITAILINFIVIINSQKQIIKKNNLKKEKYDCAIVLGASVVNDKPSLMLKDRLQKAIELYQEKRINKILVSGDHETDDYNEVKVMKEYLLSKGIPSEDIFLDHYGISTYDSIYRLKKIYKANKVIIISQKYHLYRAIHIANSLGISNYGISAKEINYKGQTKREIREFVARIKDFFKCITKSESKYLGKVYNIGGNGNNTDNKK